jgi:hypothetical protein
MSLQKGYLLVAMEPPPALEEEFNDWYDTEHVPERLAVEGFETGRRYVCTLGWPRYLAFYDLRDAAVIDSPGYAAISGENFSPWTKRILRRVRGFYRSFGAQVHSRPAQSVNVLRLLMLRYREVDVAREAHFMAHVRSRFEAHSAVAGLRLLRVTAAGPVSDYLALVELGALATDLGLELRSFGARAYRVDWMNEYAPYAGGPDWLR